MAWLTGRRRPSRRLGVVVDQHGAAVLVAGQAVQRQAEDVLGPPARVDRDLGGGYGLGLAQPVQAGAKHGHDLRWQVTAGLAALRPGGDVGGADGEVAGQPGSGLPGPGQAHAADPGQHGAGSAAGEVAVIPADRPGRFQVAEAVEEGHDIGPAQRGRPVPAIRAGTQALRQVPGRADFLPDRPGGAVAAVPGQFLGHPPLDGLAQPLLDDAGEGQRPAVTEHRQVPGVLGLLAARVGQRPADMARHRAQLRPDRLAGDSADVKLADRGDLLTGQRIAGPAQVAVCDLRPAAGALPDPEQHLHDHQRRQPVQADLPVLGIRAWSAAIARRPGQDGP